MAGLLNQLSLVFFAEALAKDFTNSTSSDIFISSDSILEEDSPNEEATIQNSLFIQSSCSLSNGCGESKKEEIEVKEKTTKQEYNKIIVTAYSSTYDQTDASPFITANGTYVRDGIVACNFLPFGTKIRFPEYFGDKIFTVQDRMAKKNNQKIDIWMPSRAIALQFGVKRLAIEVIE